LPSLRLPLDRDHGVFLTMGRCILEGGIPYQDCWDTKPPGVFYLFAVIARLFGSSIWGVRVVDLFWLMALSYLLFRFAERALGPRVAALGVAFHSVAYFQLGYRNTANPESFLMLPVLGSFLIVLARRGKTVLKYSLAGALMGVAFWFKFNAIIFAPLVLILPYLERKSAAQRNSAVSDTPGKRGEWIRIILAFAGGLMLVGAAVPLYFLLTGAWQAFYETFFKVVPLYTQMAIERTPSYLWWSLAQLQMRLGLWTELMLAAVLALAWKPEERRKVAPVLLAALLGLVSVAVQFRFWIYSFATSLPFLSVLWAYVAVRIFGQFRSWSADFGIRSWRVARVLVWVVPVSLVLTPFVSFSADFFDRYRSAAIWARGPEAAHRDYSWNALYGHWGEMMEVIDFVKGNSDEGDSVYVWGFEPLIYYRSDRRSPTRFITNMPQIAPWCPPEWREELMRELRADPPTLLVVNRDDAVYPILYTRLDSEQSLAEFPALTQFLTERYISARDFHAFHVFRLRR
ncbi:MAG: glycosyltransferase family 39 protein, partial [Acidobacteria bacterium]|nr:glycosyltransferase family 39 protein [Acidobacteriota bacterium]